MKKIFLIISVFMFALLLPTSSQPSFASTKQTFYAKVENPFTYFYSSPIKSDECKLFEIPQTYFVLLYDDENEFFYKAKYSDIDGYVLKDLVTPVNETPNYPYASSSFRVFTGTNLYSKTERDAADLTLSPLSTISSFYGLKTGEELIPNSTDVWYYCSYYSEGVKNIGYVFSYYCDQFQKIQPNSETVTPIIGDIRFETPDDVPANSLSSSTKVLIVVACAVPCVIVIFLLLKKKSPIKKEKKLLKKPRKDFYEFNEDDI